MTITDDYIFVHLPKTAGTFISSFLENECGGFGYNKTKLTQHTPIHKVPNKMIGNRKFVGAIRNPMDYYVSLYTFKRNKTHGIGEGKWDDVWDLDQPFQDFLFSVYDDERNKKFRKNVYKFAYWDYPMVDWMLDLDVGLLTMHYIYMYFADHKQIFSGQKDVFTDHHELLSVGRMIRVENLIHDMVKCFDLNKDQSDRLVGYKPINSSNRRSYEEYYSKDLEVAVRYKERLLFDNFYGELI